MDDKIETYSNCNSKGFIKVWAVKKDGTEKVLLVDKPNLILYGGADLMAQALAGVPNSAISYMYIGYNDVSGSFTPPLIDKPYTVPFTGYGGGSYATYGYLRLPLSYTPSFIAQENYSNNIAVFTTIITGGGDYNGAIFSDSDAGTPSQIFEVALIAAENPSNATQDKVFSRANFTPLLYDPNFNLTITWGVQFTA